MFQSLTLLLLPPMLIEFCILRCGFKSVPLSILISAFLNSALCLGLYIACNWGIEFVDAESQQTPSEHIAGRMIFYTIFVVLVTAVSLIPAALCGIVCSKFRRARHEPAS